VVASVSLQGVSFLAATRGRLHPEYLDKVKGHSGGNHGLGSKGRGDAIFDNDNLPIGEYGFLDAERCKRLALSRSVQCFHRRTPRWTARAISCIPQAARTVGTGSSCLQVRIHSEGKAIPEQSQFIHFSRIERIERVHISANFILTSHSLQIPNPLGPINPVDRTEMALHRRDPLDLFGGGLD
jgi:hypothetical protein